MDRKRITTISVLSLGLLLLSAGNAQSQEVDWKAFSANLVRALQSDNEGLQQSAMCLIIEHSENVNVDAGAFDLLQIFRHHENRGMRVLAMTALYKIHHNFGLFLIQRSITLDRDPLIRKRSRHLMNDYQTRTALQPTLQDGTRFSLMR